MMTPTGIRAMQVMQIPAEPAGGHAIEGASIEKTQEHKAEDAAAQTSYERTREKLRQQFREGRLDERMVELDVRDRNMPSFEFMSTQGPEEMDMNLKDMLPGLFGQRTKKRKMKVAEAFEYLVQEEEGRLIDMDQVTRLAVERVEDSGMVFLDEIDKIAGREGGHGPDVIARRRAAGHSADCGRDDGQYASMGWCRPTTFCLSRRARSMCRSRAT